MARAFVAALSDIDNNSSEDPSSDEDEPDKNDEKKENMKDFNGLCFMANSKQSSDEPDISELYEWLCSSWCFSQGITSSSYQTNIKDQG
ncbi:hypothetical protein GUJ93_ZPchr0379g18705 [Zizania palustris]|uniref:Uncharacterized protein n=1 Tax=Zizania palustris TaxID=103762 RepID=A0A8J5TGU8_ZIZPA|nr:hypothetical protein GUJ93_ZPchr0379g18705 [Zizania palustris]